MNPPLAAYGFLALAIVSEVTGSSLLQKSEQFSKALPTIGMAICFTAALLLPVAGAEGHPARHRLCDLEWRRHRADRRRRRPRLPSGPRPLGNGRHEPDRARVPSSSTPCRAARSTEMQADHPETGYRRKKTARTRPSRPAGPRRPGWPSSTGSPPSPCRRSPRRPGVTKGGLLHHFPSKQALIDAVFADLLDALDRDLDARIAADPEPLGAFTRAYVASVFDMALEADGAVWAALSISMLIDPQPRRLWSELGTGPPGPPPGHRRHAGAGRRPSRGGRGMAGRPHRRRDRRAMRRCATFSSARHTQDSFLAVCEATALRMGYS